ncbi:hypothetical protein [Treponema endosymbiont of Eucomonympha sp.]|uniref:hypothetical protein n=1 Tax=Treponema endosymbiont of Eucomonympha sp. TaxID=1580831 RepID=UPI0007510C13|nr:hypothetical protein [Treponema endosymbiont of Eucomonympha sp.]
MIHGGIIKAAGAYVKELDIEALPISEDVYANADWGYRNREKGNGQNPFPMTALGGVSEPSADSCGESAKG